MGFFVVSVTVLALVHSTFFENLYLFLDITYSSLINIVLHI